MVIVYTAIIKGHHFHYPKVGGLCLLLIQVEGGGWSLLSPHLLPPIGYTIWQCWELNLVVHIELQHVQCAHIQLHPSYTPSYHTVAHIIQSYLHSFISIVCPYSYVTCTLAIIPGTIRAPHPSPPLVAWLHHSAGLAVTPYTLCQPPPSTGLVTFIPSQLTTCTALFSCKLGRW